MNELNLINDHIIVESPSNGLIAEFLWCSIPGVGVDVTETALICGVMGGCDGLDVILSNRCGRGGGFVMFEAPRARV